MKLLTTSLLCFVGGSLLAADAFPTARRTGLPNNMWTNAGVRLGVGIPHRTTTFTNMTTSHTLTMINAAIAACPSNQVVALGAGVYNLLGGRIEILKSGVTLRGATNAGGFPTTIVTNGELRVGSDFGPGENWALVTAYRITNASVALAPGSTSINISNASLNTDFVVGASVCIDQVFDGTLVKDSSTDLFHRPNRPYAQMLHITAISGNQVTFDTPIIGDYWAQAQDPQLVGWNAQYGSTVAESGMEDIDLYNDESLYSSCLGRTHNAWFKNVRVTGWWDQGGAAGMRLMWSTCPTVEDCWFHDGPLVSSSSYAIYISPASYPLIYNNIFTNVTLVMPMINAVGGVAIGNTIIGPFNYEPAEFLPECVFPHGGHTHHFLFQDNYMESTYYLDAIFSGNNSTMAAVGNRINGWYSGKTGNLIPITQEVDMDTNTYLRNILGVKGIQAAYANIYDIDASCLGTIRTNNYNTADQGINSAETLTTDTVSSSYWISGTPSKFTQTGQSYPPFNVSSGASYTNLMAYTNLPSGWRVWTGTNLIASGPSGPYITNATFNTAITHTLRRF